ncbi:PWWP domain-containing protein 5-like isoform X2 [Rhodamnia argentea]|nr:PWWP domain-containing protein 5-like isoform X2 [Rhodamnia argentea]
MTASSELETEYCRDKEDDKNCHLLPSMECVSNVGECVMAAPILPCDDLGDGTRRNGRPAELGLEISISDLVWCKIKGPYWWPGKLIGCSAGATKNYFLVACFGDPALGPVRVSLIKPLWEHFPLMEMQSGTDKLRHAVDCALDELSRRAEYVLTCRCVPREVQNRFEAQAEVNAALVKSSSQRGAEDSVLNTASFTPRELVNYIKQWGESPHDGPSRLLLSVAKSQLLAFSRWKGFPRLPKFISFGGKLENEADIMTSLGDCYQNPIEINGANPEFEGCPGMLAVKTGCYINRSNELKHVSLDMVHTGRKRKSFPALSAKNCQRMSTDEVGSDKGACGKSFAKAAGLYESESSFTGAPTTISMDQSMQFRQNHRAMHRIHKVASESNGSLPLAEHLKESPPGRSNKNPHSGLIPHDSGSRKTLLGYASPKQKLSQLCRLAGNPMRQNKFPTRTVRYFSEFRNSVVPGHLLLKSCAESAEEASVVETQSTSTNFGIAEPMDLRCFKDSVRTSTITRSIQEPRLPLENWNAGDSQLETLCERSVPSVVLKKDHQFCPAFTRGPRLPHENPLMEVKKPIHDDSGTRIECSKDPFSTGRTIQSIAVQQPSLGNHNTEDPLIECERPLPSIKPQIGQFRRTLVHKLQVRRPNPYMIGEQPNNAIPATVLELSEDSFMSSRIIQSIPKPQQSLGNQNAGDSLLKAPCKKSVPSMEPQTDCQFCPVSIRKSQAPFQDPCVETKRQSDDFSGKALECSHDTCMTSRITQSIPEQKVLVKDEEDTGVSVLETPITKPAHLTGPQTNHHFGPASIQEAQSPCENPYVEVKEPDRDVPGSCKEDYFSTALILTFTNLNLAPSVTNLNKMFSCFGPLKESESKVLNKSKQVKIIFKNSMDAEAAFIRLGEQRFVGPSLRSYRLKYVRSCSLEPSPSHVRRHN